MDEINVLERDLCDWRQFPFQKYEGNVELLGNPEWRTGRAIQVCSMVYSTCAVFSNIRFSNIRVRFSAK